MLPEGWLPAILTWLAATSWPRCTSHGGVHHDSELVGPALDWAVAKVKGSSTTRSHSKVPRPADKTIDPFSQDQRRPTLKALGIRYRPPYNARHTYATMCLMAGMTPASIAKQLATRFRFFCLGMPAGWMVRAIGLRCKNWILVRKWPNRNITLCNPREYWL